ncbi:MAG: hypothetical protein WC284_16890 [Candidimonas sp.]
MKIIVIIFFLIISVTPVVAEMKPPVKIPLDDREISRRSHYTRLPGEQYHLRCYVDLINKNYFKRGIFGVVDIYSTNLLNGIPHGTLTYCRKNYLECKEIHDTIGGDCGVEK